MASGQGSLFYGGGNQNRFNNASNNDMYQSPSFHQNQNNTLQSNTQQQHQQNNNILGNIQNLQVQNSLLVGQDNTNKMQSNQNISQNISPFGNNQTILQSVIQTTGGQIFHPSQDQSQIQPYASVLSPQFNHQNQQNDTFRLNQSAEKKNKKDEHEQTLFARCCICFSLDFYRPYFDVTTELVVERLKASFQPFKEDFFQIDHNHKPDMYGPFWIYTTLIFTLTAAGNLCQYIQNPAEIYFSYNFNYVPIAASIVYTFGFVFPVILCFIMKILGCEQMSYLKTICIYGYASTCYIPVSILCSYPNEWGFMAYSMLNTTTFLVNNFNTEMSSLKVDDRKNYIIVTVGVLQLIVLLVYKLYFFQMIYAIHTYIGAGGNQYSTREPIGGTPQHSLLVNSSEYYHSRTHKFLRHHNLY